MTTTLEALTQTPKAGLNPDIKNSSSIPNLENQLSVADKNRQAVLTFQIKRMFADNVETISLLNKVVTNSIDITIQQTLDFRNLCSDLLKNPTSEMMINLKQLIGADDCTIGQFLNKSKNEPAGTPHVHSEEIDVAAMTEGPRFNKTYDDEGVQSLDKSSMFKNAPKYEVTITEMQRERLESLPKQRKYAEKRSQEIEAKKPKSLFSKVTSFWKNLWK